LTKIRGGVARDNRCESLVNVPILTLPHFALQNLAMYARKPAQRPQFSGKVAGKIATLTRAATIAVVVALASGSRAQAAELLPWTEGPQPLFVLPTFDGPDVTLGAQHGDVVLVHFFATWCEACLEELPALMRLSQRGGPAVKVLAISVAEVDARVKRFMQSMPVKFPVLLDRDRAVAKSWKVSTLPTTFVLDSALNARLVVETDYAWDTLDPVMLIDKMSPSRDRPQHGYAHTDLGG
jgi:thiol-disulfide isomerase/thioredoxin